MITIATALRVMRKMMDEHGLHEFNPQIIRERGNVIGKCKYYSKLICVDEKWLTRTDMANFKQIVLHEIAHELDYRWYGNKGHSETFRMACKKIGCVMDGPIAHHIASPEKCILVLLGANIVKMVREVPADFVPPYDSMKVISKSTWDAYKSGDLTVCDIKAA